MVLGSRVEVHLGAHFGRLDALQVEPQLPPAAVEVLLGDVTGEHAPAPLVHDVAERQEGDLVQRHRHQEVHVHLQHKAPRSTEDRPARQGVLGKTPSSASANART